MKSFCEFVQDAECLFIRFGWFILLVEAISYSRYKQQVHYRTCIRQSLGGINAVELHFS